MKKLVGINLIGLALLATPAFGFKAKGLGDSGLSWRGGLIKNPAEVVDNIDRFSGWRVGNGGDGLRLSFLKARSNAAHISNRIQPASLSGSVSNRVSDWILANKLNLASDILASQHKWIMQEEPTCAWTQPPNEESGESNHADILLSFKTCRQTTADFNSIVQLLIHESVHHFGVTDELFADEVALAIVNAWKAGKTEWLTLSSAAPMQAHSAVWTGEQMVVFGGLDGSGRNSLNHGYVYDAQDDEWQAISKKKAPARHEHSAVWLDDDRMFVWGGYSMKNGRQSWVNAGSIWDKKTNSWKSIKYPFGPSKINSRFGKVQTISSDGQNVLVWGGVDGKGNAIGAIYNAKLDKWLTINKAGAPARLYGHSSIFTGKKLIVWGGVNAARRRTNEGAIYDFLTDEWISLPVKNAPVAVERHTAVWTGSQMIVFGGYESSSNLKATGGIYDLKAKTWQSFESETAMARLEHSAIWTGSEMIVWGGKSKRMRTYLKDVVAFNPVSGHWRSVSSENTPSARSMHAAVWANGQLMIHGGKSRDGTVLANGGIFYP